MFGASQPKKQSKTRIFCVNNGPQNDDWDCSELDKFLNNNPDWTIVAASCVPTTATHKCLIVVHGPTK